MKVVIENENIKLNGKRGELIAGLSCYALALLEEGTSFKDIEWACEMAKKEHENNIKVNTVYEDKDFSIHEINVEGITKEEIKNFILKELLGGNQNVK